MSLVALEGGSRTIGPRKILDEVSIVVGEGDRIGLVGVNGCGKSTLLRLLAGQEELDDGRRTVRRGLKLGFLPQEPEVPAGQSVRAVVRSGLGERAEVLEELDAVHAEMAEAGDDPDRLDRLLRRQAQLDDRLTELGGHDIEHRIESLIHDVGLPDPEALCTDMSGGERRRVALARLLIGEPELLLLDEPTNHLDAEVVQWLEDFLLAQSGAMVLVTHDRYFLDRAVTRIVEVDRSKLFSYDGGYADYLGQRAERIAREERGEQSRLNALRRETAWIRRGPPARTTKSKSRIQAYEKLKDDVPDAEPGEVRFEIPPGPRLGEKVLTLTGITKRYGERTILEGLDLELMRGQRLGVVGPNGAGKTTFVRIAVGELEADEGRREVGPTVEFGYVDQNRAELRGDLTVVEAVGGGNDHVPFGDRKVRVETFMERFLFPSERLRTRVDALSGGERNRVQLARLLARGGNVLVLDEPTNDLDLATLRILEEALCDFPGTVICVSHDRWFLDRVATRVLHVGGDGHHRIWDGPLSFLLERLEAERDAAARVAAEAQAAERARKKAAEQAERQTQARSGNKLSWAERQELEGIEDAISAAEQDLADLDAVLGDPLVYTDDPREVLRLTEQRPAIEAKIEQLYARWEDLESRAD